MRFFFSFIFLLFTYCGQAQFSEVEVSFKAVYGDKPLLLNESFVTDNNDTIDVSTLKFYISSVEMSDYRLTSIIIEDHLHLIDFSKESNSFKFELPTILEYKSIKFNLGIDSITNVSGAHGGDLDPTKGMYWTWQSGYINFKLEGHANKSSARKNEFTFHLGGYSFPNYALQRVRLPLKSKKKIVIVLDVKKIIENLDFETEYKVMSPSARAVELSKNVANSFYTE